MSMPSNGYLPRVRNVYRSCLSVPREGFPYNHRKEVKGMVNITVVFGVLVTTASKSSEARRFPSEAVGVAMAVLIDGPIKMKPQKAYP